MTTFASGNRGYFGLKCHIIESKKNRFYEEEAISTISGNNDDYWSWKQPGTEPGARF
jgi:hypothetical protein